MQILQVGLSHRTAPVELREQLAISEAALPSALKTLCPSNGDGPGYALEGAILSTCNRLEVYAVVDHPDRGQKAIREYLARISGVDQDLFDPYLRASEGEAAVTHLCEVACGLDSLVLGESQIQGQVAQAFQIALSNESAGTVISALFRTALRAGKRARTETAINEHATSISHVAVELSGQIFDDLGQRRVLLIGAGEMAELAAKNLVDNGVGGLLVVNRSLGRAASLAKQYGGEALGWDRLNQALCQADIVISSTSAPHAILHPAAVAAAMHMRRHRPLFIIDIALPRDVEPAVGELANVFLYDIDDLQQVVETNLAQRRNQVPRVQAIIHDEVKEFEAWFRARDVVPTIVDLRQRVEQIRESELEWALQKLDGLSDHERSVVLSFSRRLVNKILHQPTIRLKERANSREAYQYAEAVRELFGIEDCESGPEDGSQHG